RRFYRACANTAEPTKPTVKEPKITELPQSARRPHRLRTGGHHPRPPAVQHLRAARRPPWPNQACPPPPRRGAVGMTAAFRMGRHDCSDLHRHLDIGCILAMAKVLSRSAANAMY